MFMFGLSETIDQLAMANSDRWYGQVLRRADGLFCGGHLFWGWKSMEEWEAKDDMVKARCGW